MLQQRLCTAPERHPTQAVSNVGQPISGIKQQSPLLDSPTTTWLAMPSPVTSAAAAEQQQQQQQQW
jgi:hypothetical protein